MRNWNCRVKLYVADSELQFFFKTMEIGNSAKKVIFCKISKTEKTVGTILEISNCPSKLIEEFKFGLRHFYYDRNPLFGAQLASTYQHDIKILKSGDKSGYIFYGKLLRKKIDLPIVIICNKAYKTIDLKIGKDRDRQSFNDEVLCSLLKLIFKNFSNYDLGALLLHLEPWWEKGDKYLAIIAATQGSRYSNGSSNVFSEDYYAKESMPSGPKEKHIANLTTEILEEYRKLGYKCCPRYMSYFGMKTPDSEAKKKLKEKSEKMNKIYSRDASLLEKQAIDRLSYFIKEISQELYHKFETARYTIGESDEIVGELKSKRDYKDQHIFLDKTFFQLRFSDALAILLHEWAHIYGYDGSRSFSDALTSFIAMILNNESALGKLKEYEIKWKFITRKIFKEKNANETKVNIEILLLELPREKMAQVLHSIPQEELYKLLEQNRLL
jgi:hypothetical protein